MPRKQLAAAITQLVDIDPEVKEGIDNSTIEDYKKLNDKCDKVISKIKSRKGKKNSQQSGE